MSKTYIISEDISSLLLGAGLPAYYFKRQKLKVPEASLIAELRADFKDSLQSIFPCVKIYTEGDLRSSLAQMAANARYPLVSLDRIYLFNNPNVCEYLDASRITTNGKTQMVLRNNQYNYSSLDEEIATLADRIKAGCNSAEIVIADDILFSGECMLDIVKRFERQQVFICGAICALATKDGCELMRKNGVEVSAAYKIDNFVDQICERDFYFGLPQSGMLMQSDDGQFYKQPYFLPFGKPEERASIPASESLRFSCGCINRSRQMWQQIEKLSGCKVALAELPENIYNSYGRTVMQALTYAERNFERS